MISTRSRGSAVQPQLGDASPLASAPRAIRRTSPHLQRQQARRPLGSMLMISQLLTCWPGTMVDVVLESMVMLDETVAVIMM
jgi:hypothetical protein